MPELMNSKREAFCQRIKGDMDYRQAYMEAFECSKSTAGPGATRLMKHPGIADRILELRKEIGVRLNFGENDLFNELLGIIRFNFATFFYPDGTLKDITEIPESIGRMITSIDVQVLRKRSKETNKYEQEVSIVKIKVLDKMKAYEMIGRMMGAFNENININQQNQLAIQHIVVPPMKEIGAPVDSRVLEADNDRR